MSKITTKIYTARYIGLKDAKGITPEESTADSIGSTLYIEENYTCSWSALVSAERRLREDGIPTRAGIIPKTSDMGRNHHLSYSTELRNYKGCHVEILMLDRNAVDKSGLLGIIALRSDDLEAIKRAKKELFDKT